MIIVKMKKLLFLFLGFCLIIQARNGFSQITTKDDNAEKYAQYINTADLKKHLLILASDEYEGRETGFKGQKMAAEYIQAYFKELGLPPIVNGDSYFQKVPLSRKTWAEPTITINGEKFEFLKDFFAYPRTCPEITIDVNQIAYAGYGVDENKYSDFSKISVKDKVVMVYKGEPRDKRGNYKLSGNDERSKYSSNWRKKIDIAKKQGAKMLLIVNKDIEGSVDRFGFMINSNALELDLASDEPSRYVPTIYISQEMATKIEGAKSAKFLKKRLKGKSASKIIPLEASINIKKNSTQVFTENVLGYIEGSDLKDELVVVTAHYDHIGMNGEDVFNGADDDGSGTVAVLEMAEAFVEAKKNGNGPRRSILIMPVSGEEKGLLGSKYYAANPIFPLEKTVANLNIDMVGRVDAGHENDKNYVYVIGSDFLSTELHKINEEVNEHYVGLNLDYKYNSKTDPNRFYYRSDHYNFAKNNIPIIFYFNGTHADYHQATDTEEKIEYPVLEKRSRLVFYTAWHLANMDKRIEVDVEQD